MTVPSEHVLKGRQVIESAGIPAGKLWPRRWFSKSENNKDRSFLEGWEAWSHGGSYDPFLVVTGPQGQVVDLQIDNTKLPFLLGQANYEVVYWRFPTLKAASEMRKFCTALMHSTVGTSIMTANFQYCIDDPVWGTGIRDEVMSAERMKRISEQVKTLFAERSPCQFDELAVALSSIGLGGLIKEENIITHWTYVGDDSFGVWGIHPSHEINITIKKPWPEELQYLRAQHNYDVITGYMSYKGAVPSKDSVQRYWNRHGFSENWTWRSYKVPTTAEHGIIQPQ